MKALVLLPLLFFALSAAADFPAGTLCGPEALMATQIELQDQGTDLSTVQIESEMIDWNYRPCPGDEQEQSLGCGYETWSVSVTEKNSSPTEELIRFIFDFNIKNGICGN